jgi:uncharacterized membrane protein
MSIIHIELVIAVVAAGGFAGIIAAMAGILQRTLNDLEYREYTIVMQGIITSGRKAVIVWTMLLAGLGAGAASVISLWGDLSSPAFLLALGGLIAFIVGPILVSRWLNEPWYDQVMAWTPGEIRLGWQQARMQWYWFNLARLLIALLSCLLFTLALVQL